jgi:TadE-like protein
MKKRGWTICGNLARDRRGSEIAETAMILPLLFMFVMAIFWFGQAFRIYGAITHAARQGARAAVAPACTTCTAPTGDVPLQNATTAVSNDFASAHLSTAPLQAPVAVPNLCACGAAPGCGAPVPCDGGPTINICVQENVQLSYPSNGGAGTCGTSVSMRYQSPFHFSIPFTDLDLRNITLYGQSQMRSETQ